MQMDNKQTGHNKLDPPENSMKRVEIPADEQPSSASVLNRHHRPFVASTAPTCLPRNFLSNEEFQTRQR